MALSISTCSPNLRLVARNSKPLLPQPQPHLAAIPHPPKPSIHPLVYSNRPPPHPRRLHAQENRNEGFTEPEEQQSRSDEGSMTEVAAELKQMLKEKKESELQQQQDENLLMGVAQEVREIEWPDLGKVLGTTGVVLAVIAGSTAALLSVNAVLAEISDRVFAGKGIQDFF